MPESKTRQRAAKHQTPSTQAGEYVREEMDHIREGKHGARSAKQAIAIGLSKARRAGVKLPPPPGGKKEPKATNRKPSAKRSRATLDALQREGSAAASHEALSRHARASARDRGRQREKVRRKRRCARKARQAEAPLRRRRHERAPEAGRLSTRPVLFGNLEECFRPTE